VLEVASASFAERGVAGTSLDELARRLGVTKQTILYHFKSKDGLIDAVVESAALVLHDELARALDASEPGWDRIEASVRAVFALAVRRPELLGLLREVSRLGPPHSDVLAASLAPLVDRSIAALERGMAAGTLQRSDPRLLLALSYALTTGVVTDTEVLRVLGMTLDLRVAAQLRRTVLDFLRVALAPGAPT
jgi:TetR/AcrR family transcriptional regulator